MSRDFWDYAKDINKVSSIEEVFSDWVNSNNLSLDEAKKAWDVVNNDLRTVYAANIQTLNQKQEISEKQVLPSVENVNNKNEGSTLIRGILTS